MPAIYLIVAIAAIMSNQIAVDLTPRRGFVHVSPTVGLKAPIKHKKDAPAYTAIEPSYRGNWIGAGRN
jgi:hypothetical protein